MMETKEMIATTFTIDDGTYYPGHYDPTDRWNGWANPYFTLTTIEEIVDDVNEFYEDYDGWEHSIAMCLYIIVLNYICSTASAHSECLERINYFYWSP